MAMPTTALLRTGATRSLAALAVVASVVPPGVAAQPAAMRSSELGLKARPAEAEQPLTRGHATPGERKTAPEPPGIVYFGNSRTGASVRVYNKPDGMKLAKEQVEKIGGDGWSLYEHSTTPGFGAAICTKKGDTINFHTAHGYATSKEAVAAATAKARAAGGMTSFCSNALWRVNESPAPRQRSTTDRVLDAAKNKVREKVSCDQSLPKVRRSKLNEEWDLPEAQRVEQARLKKLGPHGTPPCILDDVSVPGQMGVRG